MNESYYSPEKHAQFAKAIAEIAPTLPTRAKFLARAIEAVERIHEIAAEYPIDDDVAAIDFVVDLLVDESVRIVRREDA